MKRIMAGVLALTLIFGGTALPAADSGVSLFDTAVTAEADTYGDYDYKVLDDGTVEITKYTGSSTSVSIPSTIDGRKVTSIGYEAFCILGCDRILSVAIPDSVTTIGSGAFFQCTSLSSVTIPDSVTSIGDFAFEECTSLTNITIPNSVTSIGKIAFCGCTSLESITLPDSVTSIGESTFNGCVSLKSITIPDSVTSIGGWAFENCTSLTNITIPDSVTSIGNEAFSNCTSLTNITIPASVTSIGGCAFNGTKWLKNKRIEYSLVIVNSILIDGATSNGNVIIPNSVTSIGDSAFYYCTDLTAITIPNSVTSIGNSAFENCKNLSSVTIPNSVTAIKWSAFCCCENLTSITIPNSVTSIGNYAFENCTSLKNITIPDSVTSIGFTAFKNCTSLSSVTIPNSVTSINVWTFYNCTSLKKIIIPDSVTSIGYLAFSGCDSLTDVYYIGSEEDWNKISIGDNNSSLTDANIHFHTHSYKSEVTKSATCTAAGERTYTCAECGDTYTETISATGHKFGAWKTTKKATCKETGTQTRTCSTCGKTETKTIAKTAHTYKTTVVAPTYESQGYTLHTCTECGESYKDNYTAKKTVATVKPTTFSCTDTAIRINWNKVEDAAGYKVYRYNTSTKKWNTVATLSGADTLTYKQTGLKAGTTYKYKVKAYVKSNGKTYWGESSRTMTTTTKPAKVVMKSSYSATSNAVRINWNTVTGATGYRVYRYDPKTKKYAVIATIKDGSANTYRDSKSLKSKTTYKYKVKAYRKVNDVNYWGSASDVKTCTTK